MRIPWISSRKSTPISTTWSRWQTLLLVSYSLVYLLSGGLWLIAPSPALSVIGAVSCALGLLLILLSIITLRRVVQIEPAPRADGELVTRGVYRWLRHPIYTAIILVVIGLFLRKPTIINGVAMAAVVVFLALKVPFEEKLLSERYPQYVDYKRRTWGLIPWPKRSLPADS